MRNVGRNVDFQRMTLGEPFFRKIRAREDKKVSCVVLIGQLVIEAKTYVYFTSMGHFDIFTNCLSRKTRNITQH